MKHITFLLPFLLACFLSVKAQNTATEADNENLPVETIVQCGHSILSYDISPDEKYVATSDKQSVAIWDLSKRRIIRRIPFANRGVRFNAVFPTRVYIRPENDWMNNEREATYYAYDIFTGLRRGVKIGRDLLPRKRSTNDLIFKYDVPIIKLIARSTQQPVGELNGNEGIPTARIMLSANDSLLALTGLMPPVWDLKRAELVGIIPYRDFLKSDSSLYFLNDYTIPLPKTDTYHIKQRSYQYGYSNHYSGEFTADNHLLLGGFNPYITRWTIDGKLLDKIKTDGSPVFAFIDNGEYRAAATYQGLNMARADSHSLSECTAFNQESHYKLLYDVSPVFQGKYFLTSGDDRDLLLCELGKPKFRKKLMQVPCQVHNYALSPSGEKMLMGGELQYVAEMGLSPFDQGIRYQANAFRGASVYGCAYLDENHFAAGCKDGILGFWESGKRDPIVMMRAHKASIEDIQLTHDGKRLLTADADGVVRVWDAATRDSILTFQQLGLGKDYIFLTPDNYYKASRGAFDYIHFARGMEVYSFDQFDLKYNRPDIVMERLGASPRQVEIYRRAWQKRVRRMGYTEEMLSGEIHAPKLQVVDKQSLPVLTQQSTIKLKISASDSKYALSRLFINLNGVPLFGKNGRPLSVGAKKIFQTIETIELAAGDNRIDLFCMNEKGVESYKEQVLVYCNKSRKKPSLYIAAVGVSHYLDNRFDLTYASKDARDFVQAVSTLTANRFAKIHPLVLIDEAFAPRSLSQLKQFFAQAGRDDVVMLFYAGHGVLNAELDYFLSTHAMNFDRPQQDGIDYRDFEDVLDGISSVYKYCFIDACHSGEIDKDDYLAENTLTQPVGKVVFRQAGVGARKLRPNGVAQVNALVKDLFMDIRYGVGATILSGAGGMEAALEGSEWKNGLFTWCLKKGLAELAADRDANGQVSISELMNYVCTEVKSLSHGFQSPNVRMANFQHDFILVGQP